MFNAPVQTQSVQLAEANNRHDSATVGKAIMTAPMIPPTNTKRMVSTTFFSLTNLLLGRNIYQELQKVLGSRALSISGISGRRTQTIN